MSTESDDEIWARLRSMISTHEATLRARMEAGDLETARATLPTSTQMIAYLFDATGLGANVRASKRTRQRQKAGAPTARLADVPLRALVRLIVDALRPFAEASSLDVDAAGVWVDRELAGWARSWDAMVSAIGECLDEKLAKTAALRVLMLELAVRRAALARIIGAEKCPPWFALAPQPFDAALKLLVEHHGIKMARLRLALELAGINGRTFESWRHEPRIPAAETLELVAEEVAKLSTRPSGKSRSSRQQILGVLRCARAAKLLRRDLAREIGDDALRDLAAGHQRIAEVVFDTLTPDALGLGTVSALLTMPVEAWASQLREQAAFDPELRALVEPDAESWRRFEERATTDFDRKFVVTLRDATPSGRLAMIRVLLVVGMADAEGRRWLVPLLVRGTLDEIAMRGPRARAFPFLCGEIERRLPSAMERADIEALVGDPRPHLVALIARGEVLAALASRVAENGTGGEAQAEAFTRTARELLRFDGPKPS